MNNTKERRFVHKNGFGDNTDYVGYDGKDIYLILKNGDKTYAPSDFNINTCENFVSQGLWIEI